MVLKIFRRGFMRDQFYMATNQINLELNVGEFMGPDARASSPSESVGLMTVIIPYTLNEWWVRSTGNNRDGDTVLQVRNNQADVPGATITIPASTTGLFKNTAVDEPFVAEDRVGWQIKSVGGAVGNINWRGVGGSITYNV